jgi:hypothetical protein
MTDKAISPLRRRLIEDMAIRRLGPKTQLHYIRHVKRFADFLGRPADKATAEDVHRYQLWLASIGTTVPTVNVSATAPLEGGRPPVRHYAGLEGVIKPAIACPSAHECRFFVPLL